MARDFGVTNPKYLKVLKEIREAMKNKPQSYWDEQMKAINDFCSKLANKSS